jgi:hypothetical protein
MSATMRAKFQIASVESFSLSEKVKFHAVAKSSTYDENGSDEDNTYAKFSPMASCEILIANPALLGKFEPGQKFYVDFTPAAT